jgi:hypothetical protein
MDARTGVNTTEPVKPGGTPRRHKRSPWMSRQHTEAYLLARETLRRIQRTVTSALPGQGLPRTHPDRRDASPGAPRNPC